MNFPRKAYGAIFVRNESDIDQVESIIKDMDEFEYDYLPDDFIKVFEPHRDSADNGKTYLALKLPYTHKFDALDLNNLVLQCWARGIEAFYMIGPEYLFFDELRRDDR